MPRFLVACDKFKGSLTAPEACAAVARGILRALPDADVDCCPIADGGEGFVDAILSAVNGRRVSCDTMDALGRPVNASYGLVDTDEGRTAILEMAEAAGLWRLKTEEIDILRADTRGVGIMLRDAVERHGAERLVLGIGGSATNDGGAGLAQALGVRFLDGEGKQLEPTPAGLARLARVERQNLFPLPPLTVACDVSNTLLGPRGATRIFGPQKGSQSRKTSLCLNTSCVNWSRYPTDKTMRMLLVPARRADWASGCSIFGMPSLNRASTSFPER